MVLGVQRFLLILYMVAMTSNFIHLNVIKINLIMQVIYTITYQNIHILNEVLVDVTMDDVVQVFPEITNNTEMRRWTEIDIENSHTCKLFNFQDDFDVILLDGGEFTTYHEFKRIEDHCKYLLLDDINTNKCKKIVKEIKSNPTKWNVLEENTRDRNGFIVCVKSW